MLKKALILNNKKKITSMLPKRRKSEDYSGFVFI
jgi:hypothetical protein